jgi:HPt (histidine-containing phosphotransfer) domain-containing protein
MAGLGDGAPVSLAAALRYVDGDRTLLAELVVSFVSDYGERLATLRAAVAAGERAEVERTAHNFKGVLAILGAEPARNMAEELERLGRESSLADRADLLDQFESEVHRVVTWLDDWRRSG